MVTTVLDTSACIYLLNGGERQRRVRALMADGGPLLVCAVTITELLTLPYRNNDTQAVATTEAFIEALEVIPVSPEIAREAAVLRGAHQRLRTPDALIIATASLLADRVIGNDRAWLGICTGLQLVDE